VISISNATVYFRTNSH